MTGRGVATALAIVVGCADPAPFRIAVVEGNGAHQAAELAAEDINAAGGIRGRLLEIVVVIEPEDVTPQNAIATADSLASEPGVLAVIGHGGSGTSLAASQVYNARRVPQLAPTTSSPLYTTAGPYSFRMVASDDHQAEFIARQVEGMREVQSVAVLYDNDDYGVALRRALAESLRRRALRVDYEAPFIGGPGFEREVTGIVQSVAAADPDLLIWIGLTPELRLLRDPLRRALPGLRVLGSDGVSFIGAGPDGAAFQGDWVVSLTDIHSAHPELRAVADRFKPLAGRSLTDAAALVYDAVGVLADAMRNGADTRDAIQRYLESGAASGRTYAGITGTIAFDENGDAQPSYVLLEIVPGGTRVAAR
jgi:branched-chain amino acid transport system substrate-binding protein